jgi:hypothetical protein
LSRSPAELALEPLQILASRAGQAWADERTRELQVQRRAIVGAWPGTMTEATSVVLVALAGGDHGSISPEDLRALARTANRAARDAWRAVAIADEEV